MYLSEELLVVEPYVRLWRAVLDEAVDHVIEEALIGGDVDEVLSWFAPLTDGQLESSFTTVCDLAFLEPSHVRKHVHKRLKKAGISNA